MITKEIFHVGSKVISIEAFGNIPVDGADFTPQVRESGPQVRE